GARRKGGISLRQPGKRGVGKRVIVDEGAVRTCAEDRKRQLRGAGGRLLGGGQVGVAASLRGRHQGALNDRQREVAIGRDGVFRTPENMRNIRGSEDRVGLLHRLPIELDDLAQWPVGGGCCLSFDQQQLTR